MNIETKTKRCMCQGCKKKISILCFTCKFCNKEFCTSHQLPENHHCNIQNSEIYKEWRNKDIIDFQATTKQQIHRYTQAQ